MVWRIPLINFVNDFNNREIICHKKVYSTDRCKSRYYLFGSSLYELICNYARKLIALVVEAKAINHSFNNTFNTILSTRIMPLSITIICYSESYKLLLMMLRLNCLRLGNYSSNGIYFNSFFLSSYLKRAKAAKSCYHVCSMGVFTDDFH